MRIGIIGSGETWYKAALLAALMKEDNLEVVQLAEDTIKGKTFDTIIIDEWVDHEVPVCYKPEPKPQKFGYSNAKQARKDQIRRGKR